MLHPIEFMTSLVKRETNVREVEFSVYRSHPGTLMDDCKITRIAVEHLEPAFEKLLAKLDPDEDLAIRSLVHVAEASGAGRHVPMVDFATPDQRAAEEASAQLIGELEAPDAALFASGRSYHLYVGVLLSHADWVRFMGRILLLNDRGSTDMVDARWVGHRLMAGAAALRWSNGRMRHGAPPRLVRHW